MGDGFKEKNGKFMNSICSRFTFDVFFSCSSAHEKANSELSLMSSMILISFSMLMIRRRSVVA